MERSDPVDPRKHRASKNVDELPILFPVLEVNELLDLASQLDDDRRLRLAVQVWKSLPASHRAALRTLLLEDRGDQKKLASKSIRRLSLDKFAENLSGTLFLPDTTSGIYSAPRRFDLATVFVVTAAYSLLLGGLTAAGAPWTVKLLIGSVVTMVGLAQAVLKNIANPRGVSIVVGAATYGIILSTYLMTLPRTSMDVFYLESIIAHILKLGPVGALVSMFAIGAVGGYLAGALVGGVFLLADRMRGKLQQNNESHGNDTSSQTMNG